MNISFPEAPKFREANPKLIQLKGVKDENDNMFPASMVTFREIAVAGSPGVQFDCPAS
jgi:hypothetical protein